MPGEPKNKRDGSFVVNELSLFTGAGGLVWATKYLLGWRTIGYVEQDAYCRKVIRQRVRDGLFDDAPIFFDVRAFDGRPYRNKVDCITAGFPCQPFSVAGQRRCADDERNMWPETIRVIREVRPEWVFLENVPGLLVSYFGTILGDLAEAGYDARWTVLSASGVGAPHRRARLWIVAHTNSQPLWAKQESGTKREDPALSTNVSWWTIEPRICRVAHGVANGRHRLKALGNGIVPAVAARAWEELVL